MSGPGDTSWTLIHAAARGEASAREAFGRTYLPPVRAYLADRWRGTRHAADVDDAVQEVFLDFLRPRGALERADESRPGGFRAFLYGVARTVALRVEARIGRVEPVSPSDLDARPAGEDGLSTVFEREWALSIMRSAGRLQEERARAAGPEAVRRVELLSLRFQEGTPIREIAERWRVDPAWLHHQYATAREEFHRALQEVVREHHGGGPRETEEECERLLSLLE